MWDDHTTVAWLADRGIGPGRRVDLDVLDVGDPDDIPDMPDRVGLVFGTAGPGEALEGVLDVVGFQLRIRGPQGDPHTPAQDALTAYNLIRFAPVPVWVGDVRLVAVTPSGGRPARLSVARDADRATYVCTYLLTVGELSHEEMINYG